MPPRNVAILLGTILFSALCYVKTTHHRYAALVAEAMEIVRTESLTEVQPRQLFDHAMAGMVERLDPYSQYVPPGKLQSFQESIEQEFGGIGIVVERDGGDGRIVVVSTMLGSPAHQAGIRAGDTILAVDNLPTRDMSYEEVRSRIRGKPGTTVRLTVRHLDESQDQEVLVERAIINVLSVLGDVRDAEGNWVYVLEGHPTIGYVRIVTFGEKTVSELKTAISRLPQPLDGLILDVRNNSGGLLSAAVETCDLFLDEGVIVTTRGRHGAIRSTYRATPSVALPKSVPLVVLINRYSASASEIVAACLQDHGRAVVVGERSWGKGTVQNVYPFEGGRSALKLTVASYWRPNGQNIHRQEGAGEEMPWGVRPDPGLEVTLTEDQLDQLARLRQRRDVLGPVVSTGPAAIADATDTASTPPSNVNQPWQDPQLQKAVEYLRQSLPSPVELASPRDAP